MGNSSVEEIFRRYYQQTATPEEKDLLFGWINENKDQEQLLEMIQEMGFEIQPGEETIIDSKAATGIMERILNQTSQGAGLFSMKRWMYAAAAVLIALLAGSYWFFQNQNNKETKPLAKTTTAPSVRDQIRPGGNRAVLTLASGKQIILDSAANGDLASQANVKIIKLADGQIGYQNQEGITQLLYNTVATPIGGQYQLILADGSKVWLNAASSLRFPASFVGDNRTVELQGEAYFEIAHDPSKPFKVLANGTAVEVLGTHFNVNAYTDEPQLKTTLLEGKVKIENQGTVRFLTPGQQAAVEGPSKINIINDADLEGAVAWKEGKFVFKYDNIYSVMRQLSRWYDIHVQYGNNLSDDPFIGVIRIPRNESISVILNLLQKTKTVGFQLNGRTVTVTPYQNKAANP